MIKMPRSVFVEQQKDFELPPQVRAPEIVEMTEEEFIKVIGRPPVNDDLDRVNCDNAGFFGHLYCGWCPFHHKPRFVCGCAAPYSVDGNIPAIRVRKDRDSLTIDFQRISGLQTVPGMKELLLEFVGRFDDSSIELQMKQAVHVNFNRLVREGYLFRYGKHNKFAYVPEGKMIIDERCEDSH